MFVLLEKRHHYVRESGLREGAEGSFLIGSRGRAKRQRCRVVRGIAYFRTERDLMVYITEAHANRLVRIERAVHAD
jgi:hypothetical protein